MNTSHLSPQRLRHLQMLSILVAGACIPLLGSAGLEAFVLLYVPMRPPTWRDYGATAAEIVIMLLLMTISYRLVRRSTLPGITAIGVLLALMWANVLLRR
jgi:hypothetical protein